MAETVKSIVAGHRSGELTVRETVARTYERLRQADDPAIFISIREEAEVLAEARALESREGAPLPLYGVPVAVKDNIDVAGLPTTAACPAFAYTPAADAVAVRLLREAGALVIGKTNLDQFATGLVGTRSPYGTPRNPLRPELIPGGSSSGSAVAVARGIVPLALGTDTAGSGRVPAGLNNIVGLKPSLGLVSTVGVVPACRSLDCVSIFALTADDALAALSVLAPPGPGKAPVLRAPPPSLRIGVPRKVDRIFAGDAGAEAAFATAERVARELGATLVEVDLTPFFECAALLYDGPWIAERTAAVGDFIARHPDEVHPITKAIISMGSAKSAVDAFRGLYRLGELRGATDQALGGLDALMVPTMPRPCTVAEVAADPIGTNTRLGTYTNFVNLLDLAGIAVPVALASDRTPYGVTLLGRSGSDGALAALGEALHARTGLPLGALDAQVPAFEAPDTGLRPGEIAIAVVGAHLSGMPLNTELKSLSARFLETVRTAPDYRLFALKDAVPPKPGLLRVGAGTGAAIELEVWALSETAFGRFVAAVPPPLSIGSIQLEGGRTVKGFLVEAEAVAGARDISSFGGWRAFVAAQSAAR